MNKEKIYQIIAIAASGLMILFGILFLVFSAKWRSLNKNVRSLETMLTDAVKETAQLKSEIRLLSDELEDDGQKEDDTEGSASESMKESSDAKKSDASSTETNPGEEGQLSPSEEKEGVADLTPLEDQLDDMLQLSKSAAGGRWSVYVKNLNSGIFTARDDTQMKAASLIKLFVMGAVYNHYETLTQTNGKETVDRLLNIMITVSDNDAANQLVTMLGDGDSAAGRQIVTEYCEDQGYSDTSMGRMLLEESPTGENYTSVGDCADFLETLYVKDFDYSEEMLGLLQSQQRRTKIPAQIPDGVKIANKTGELSGIENDVAIVFGDKNPYIICFMTDGLTDSSTAVECIAEMSGKIYGFFNQ